MFIHDGYLNPPGGVGFIGAGLLNTRGNEGPPITWTVDATSGKGVPADASEWDDVLAAASIVSGGPSSLWLLQESGSPYADSIGSRPFGITGTVTAQQVEAGWSRLAVAPASAASATGLRVPSTADLSTSQLLYALVAFTSSSGSNVSIMSLGNSSFGYDYRVVVADDLNLHRYGLEDETAYHFGTINHGTTIHPVLLKVDTTNNVIQVYTELQNFTGGWDEPGETTGAITLGAGSGSGYNTANGLRFLYAALFSGTAAELSDANVRTLLQTLGWSVSW